MPKKATVNANKSSLEQAQIKLGNIAYSLEQDLNSITSLLTLVKYNWQTNNTESFVNVYNSDIESMKNDQKQMIENVRKFLDSVKIQYSTAEKKLNSNAERFK